MLRKLIQKKNDLDIFKYINRFIFDLVLLELKKICKIRDSYYVYSVPIGDFYSGTTYTKTSFGHMRISIDTINELNRI